MTFLAALCLVLQAQEQSAISVDWSAAAGAHTEVAAARRDFVRAVNAGDPAARAFYMPDAMGIAPDPGRVTLTLVPRRFDVDRNTASEIGTYTEVRAGSAAPVEGLYVTVYARDVNNRWRVAMEVWTTGSLRHR